MDTDRCVDSIQDNKIGQCEGQSIQQLKPATQASENIEINMCDPRSIVKIGQRLQKKWLWPDFVVF